MIIARSLPTEGAAAELARALGGRRNGHGWTARKHLRGIGTEQTSPHRCRLRHGHRLSADLERRR